MDFVNDELFPTLKELSGAAKDGRRRVVRDVFEDAYNYMKSGQLMRQVLNKTTPSTSTTSPSASTSATSTSRS
jgi:hypothetical protein